MENDIEINNAFEKRDALHGVALARLLMRPLPLEPESEVAEARRIGRWVNAAFILRPESVGGVQNVWLMVVNPSAMLKPELRLGKVQLAQLAYLDELQLPQDV
jgi:hypothetical protein